MRALGLPVAALEKENKKILKIKNSIIICCFPFITSQPINHLIFFKVLFRLSNIFPLRTRPDLVLSLIFRVKKLQIIISLICFVFSDTSDELY